MTGIRKRLRSVRGARVLLVGSSPNFDKSLDLSQFDLTVSANGSAGQLLSLGTVPDLTFMTSLLLSDKCDESDWREIRDAIGAAKAVEGLVVVRNGFHFERLENFGRFGYAQHEVTTLGLGSVHRSLSRVTRSGLAGSAPNGLPSTGVIAAAYLALFGASSIVLSGFSISTSSSSDADHFYDLTPDKVKVKPRNHSAADLLVLTSLFIRGFKLSATELELQTALTNWGSSGPKWYQEDLRSRMFWSRFAPW